MAHLSGISLLTTTLLTVIDCCNLQYCPPWKSLIPVPSRINASRQLYFSAIVRPAIKPNLTSQASFGACSLHWTGMWAATFYTYQPPPHNNNGAGDSVLPFSTSPSKSLPPRQTNNSYLNRSNCKLHTKLRPPHPRRK